MTAWAVDLFAAAFISFGVRNGAKKGIIQSVWKIGEWIITIILVLLLSKPMVAMLSQTKLYTNVYETVHTTVTEKMDNMEISKVTGGDEFYGKISSAFGIPAMLAPYVIPDFNVQSAVNGAADMVSGTAAMFFIRLIANVGLLIIIRLLLFIVFRLLNVVSKAPVLKQANRFFGGLLGFVNIMLILYLVLAAMYFVIPVNDGVYRVINETVLVRYLYNNNILLKIFIKI